MRNNKGFTLVEIMAVIAILALLLTGAGLVVTSVVSRNKQKVHEQSVGLINDAAITYVQTKKYYIPSCKKGNTYKTIRSEQVDSLNAKIEVEDSALSGVDLRNNFSSLNSNSNVVTYFKGFIDVDSEKCFKMISVKTLVDEGFLENVDYCYGDTQHRINSTVVVYAQGTTDNPDGTLVAVAPTHLCE